MALQTGISGAFWWTKGSGPSSSNSFSPMVVAHDDRRRVAGGDAGQGGLDRVRPVAGGDEQAVDGDGAAQVVGLE